MFPCFNIQIITFDNWDELEGVTFDYGILWSIENTLSVRRDYFQEEKGILFKATSSFLLLKKTPDFCWDHSTYYRQIIPLACPFHPSSEAYL